MWPGYSYLGPGNSLDRGQPVNELDKAARIHDYAYAALQKDGVNPYLQYNQADKDFQDAIQGDTSFPGNLARGLFRIKETLLPRAGRKKGGGRGGKKRPPAVEVRGDNPLVDDTEGAGGGAVGTSSTEETPAFTGGPAAKRGRIAMSGVDSTTDGDPPADSLGAGAAHAPNTWNNSAHMGAQHSYNSSYQDLGASLL